MKSRIEIEKLMKNIDVSIHVFPLEIDGKVDFIPLNEIITPNDSISFSTILTIDYNLPLDSNIELALIKTESNTVKNIKYFKLVDIELENKDDLMLPSKASSIEHMEHKVAVDIRRFEYRGTFRYDFEDVPLNGYGDYYVAVLVSDADSIISLKSVAISIKNRDG